MPCEWERDLSDQFIEQSILYCKTTCQMQFATARSYILCKHSEEWGELCMIPHRKKNWPTCKYENIFPLIEKRARAVRVIQYIQQTIVRAPIILKLSKAQQIMRVECTGTYCRASSVEEVEHQLTRGESQTKYRTRVRVHSSESLQEALCARRREVRIGGRAERAETRVPDASGVRAALLVHLQQLHLLLLLTRRNSTHCKQLLLLLLTRGRGCQRGAEHHLLLRRRAPEELRARHTDRSSARGEHRLLLPLQSHLLLLAGRSKHRSGQVALNNGGQLLLLLPTLLGTLCLRGPHCEHRTESVRELLRRLHSDRLRHRVLTRAPLLCAHWRSWRNRLRETTRSIRRRRSIVWVGL